MEWKHGADREVSKEARAALLADTAGSSAEDVAATVAAAQDARQNCVIAAVIRCEKIAKKARATHEAAKAANIKESQSSQQ